MNTKRVSVAEGKKEFTQLLKEARETQTPILIFNLRLDELAGAILSPEEYERYQLLKAYFEAIRLSQRFSYLDVNILDLVNRSRKELEGRIL